MSSRPSILIVDGNPGFAGLLKESLEQDGQYRTAVTTNGDEALQALSATAYDLAIVDLGLREPDGTELARTMRQRKAELRLILIPVRGDEIPPELSDLSIQGILPKPFFLPDLPQCISDALALAVGEATGSRERQPDSKTGEETTTPDKASSEADGARITQQFATPSEEEIAEARAGDPVAEVREHIPEIAEKMNALAQDVNAAAVLLTCKGRLISHTGRVAVDEAMGLAQAATESWRTATRVGEILGQSLKQYEHSTEGGEYTFYSLSVVEDIILSIALNTHVPIGMVRHSVKGTADALRSLLSNKV